MSEPAERPKFCRDCKHCALNKSDMSLSVCTHPEATRVPAEYLVTGKGEAYQLACICMRGPLTRCGEGIFWEKR